MKPIAHPYRKLQHAATRGLALLVLALGAVPAAHAASSCTGGLQPLQLGGNVASLPTGAVGQTYQYTLSATGGEPPYNFQAASMPPGFAISATGVLTGEPSTLPLITQFTISVHDHRGCMAQQAYKLAIVAPPAPRPPAPSLPRPPAPAPKPLPPKKPLPPTPLTTVPLADTLAEPSSPPNMDTYGLTEAIFADKDVVAQLKKMSANAATVDINAPAEEPDDEHADGEPDAADDAAPAKDDAPAGPDTKAQLQRLLKPLIGVEYPGRDLFAAALDTRLCRFSETLIREAASKQGRPAPKMSAGDCPPDWDKLAKQDDYVPHDPLPWKEVPMWLMSSSLHTMLIEKARIPHALLDPPAPQWDGAGCGCVREHHGEIYGFYPFWQTQGKPQPLDFRLLTRINLFALWFKDGGDLDVPAWTTPAQTAFIREARRHRASLDYVLYRNDWRFLKNASDDNVNRAVEHLAQQAADFIDAPLTDLASRSHAWTPGFAKVERTGDGLTLYLDNMPAATDPLRPAFARYLGQQVLALIAELRRRDRNYVLNIVLRDTDLETANSVWQVASMYDYVKQAEAPAIQDGHISIGNAQYRSKTNVTLRYLVLLTEPTGRSRRSLRAAVDQDRELNEDDRRVLLRKLVPVVSSGSASEVELADEMAYVADNFGGVGFWTAPGRSDPVGHMVSARIGAGFLPKGIQTDPTLAWICEYRWPLRLAFQLLVPLWLIAFVLYQASCRVRRFGLPYQLGLLIGAVGILVLGGILMAGDPALTRLREGNSMLVVVLVALIATIAYHLLKPRVEKP
jgi:hypothetical protein